MRLILLVSIWILSCSLSAQKPPKTPKTPETPPTDIAVDVPAPYDTSVNRKYKGIKKESHYIKMRDGVMIAIDVYLPKNLKEGEKIPVLVRQTRYWRAPQIRFPFNMFTNGLLGRMGNFITTFVENGYAIVNVDARGSGASFGERIHPWTEDEIKDGAEIIDWAISQSWCSGKVGSLGVSYGGTTAEFLATNKHPNLKAVALMFSLYDVYEDNAFPGGIHHHWFTENWGAANARMDENKLPENYKKAALFIKGVAPVKTKGGKKMKRQAVAEHGGNRNVHDGALTIDFRDDAPPGLTSVSSDVFSPHKFADLVEESGVAVYSYSGWMDGAYQNAAIKRYINAENPNNKLIIGPWEHGGGFNISPTTPSVAGFDHAAELIKFFDYHLKGIQNGLNEEAPVHYFTLGADKWQAADNWPPYGSMPMVFYLTEKGLWQLKPESPITKTIQSDGSTGTGDVSRWKSLNGKVKTAHVYHDWMEKSEHMLHFDSPALQKNVEFTGHALANIFISSSKKDATLFVYVQELAEDGTVTYITEGLLRASHRKISDEAIYKEIGPSRSHLKKDVLPVEPGEIMELEFDLVPASYMFKKGSKIRVSFAATDKDHFEILFPEGYDLNIHSTPQKPSYITLPVYPQSPVIGEQR